MLVRYKHGKHNFEVATHAGTVVKYREGELSNVSDVVTTEVIFADYNKGERASETDLHATFGEGVTHEAMLDKILRNGEFQLSAAERREKLEAKRREVTEFIHRNYVDPKTHHPIPVMRVEQALETVRVRVDPDQPADRQVAQMAPKLMACLPLKKHQMEGVLKVPHASLGASSGIVRAHCNVLREHYSSEGATLEIAFSPGDYDSFMKAMNAATKGNFQFEVAGAAVATEPEKPGKGKKPAEKKKKKKQVA